MLYQPLLIGERPYHAASGNVPGFREHRHPELELSYCLRGIYSICINKKVYKMDEGDLAIISSMASHEFPTNKNKDCLGLTIMVGPAFLSHYFEGFSKSVLTTPVISLKDNNTLSSVSYLKRPHIFTKIKAIFLKCYLREIYIKSVRIC